jgi:C4-type zinc ribbon domain
LYEETYVLLYRFGTGSAYQRAMKQMLDSLLQLQNLDLGIERVPPGGAGPEELRKKIPAQVLQHYDRLRARGKKGIAYVRHGVCGQCHMQVAVGLQAMLRRQDNVYRCENCGCYLYLMEEAPVLEMPPRNVKPGRRGRPPKVHAHAA